MNNLCTQEQEDLAHKIAEMIISDVTSVTQAVGAIQDDVTEGDKS